MKAVVIFSGGMDSTTLLYDVISQGFKVEAISFDYGQKHKKELDYAKNTCKALNISHKILDISALNEVAPSVLTRNVEVPEGHYEDESMKLTVVPNRNMVMISLAVAYAIGIEATKVFYGAHGGDRAIYPDCRKEFVEALKKAIKLCDWSKVELIAPYLDITKRQIVKIGRRLGVDYGNTWSCYNGEETHCGKCGTCVERFEALKN